MRVVKLVMALIPLASIGGLLVFLVRPFGEGGGLLALAVMPDRVLADGLGPTVVGLGAITLLLCIPVLVRLYQLVAPPAVTTQPTAQAVEEAFDPDAALARYLARKAGTPAEPANLHPEPVCIEMTPRPTFGRKSR